ISSIAGMVMLIACLWYNKRYGKYVNQLQKRVKRARSDTVNKIFEQSMQLYSDLVAKLKALVVSIRRIEKFLNEIRIHNIGFTSINVAWKDDII
ncbi:33725_t:CDS:2, partial [Gigaspora margarita]